MLTSKVFWTERMLNLQHMLPYIRDNSKASEVDNATRKPIVYSKQGKHFPISHLKKTTENLSQVSHSPT
jgi:hypothetical protein